MKNPHNSQLYSSVATKKKHVGAKRYLRTTMTLSHLLMVPVGVSEFDYRSLILFDVGVKINEICYCNVRSHRLWKVQKQCPNVCHAIVF